LNGVLGMAQAMAADPLDPIQRRRLNVVRQSGEALLGILNDILDISKIEAGKLDLEEIEFDLGEIAANTQSNFASLASEKGLSLVLDIDKARGLYRGDPARLRQILSNLISAEIHRGGRDPSRHHPCGRAVEHRRQRHRRRHFARQPVGPVQHVHPGRLIDDPPLRRHRPRAGDLP
jgi:hypothetical protein